MIGQFHGPLSIRRQCELVSVNRSGIYHHSKGESDFNLSLMRQTDEWMLDDPTLGVIGMVDQLQGSGFACKPQAGTAFDA